MGSTSGDVGSRFGEISTLCIGFHCTGDELMGRFTLRFIPHAWIAIVLRRIMGDRSDLAVGGIISVIFILPIP